MDKSFSNVVRLERAQAGKAVETLARAFSDYVLIRHFFPMKEHREKFVRYFVSIPLYYGMRYGEVYTTSHNMEGAAVWIPSQNHPLSPARVFQSVPFTALAGFAMSGAARMRAVDSFLNDAHKRLVPCEHWYLQMIGVDPVCKGKGYSSTLIKPMIYRADRENLPCFLETNTEENTRIYRHFGFEVIEESLVPGTDVMNWAMLRKPLKA